ncbi:hypothetical protein JHW43_007457 [Diplocarpon mali]|nr:hypothetical protein JHW43_007457 [Diplocarpon mali]
MSIKNFRAVTDREHSRLMVQGVEFVMPCCCGFILRRSVPDSGLREGEYKPAKSPNRLESCLLAFFKRLMASKEAAVYILRAQYLFEIRAPVRFRSPTRAKPRPWTKTNEGRNRSCIADNILKRIIRLLIRILYRIIDLTSRRPQSYQIRSRLPITPPRAIFQSRHSSSFSDPQRSGFGIRTNSSPAHYLKNEYHGTALSTGSWPRSTTLTRRLRIEEVRSGLENKLCLVRLRNAGEETVDAQKDGAACSLSWGGFVLCCVRRAGSNGWRRDELEENGYADLSDSKMAGRQEPSGTWLTQPSSELLHKQSRLLLKHRRSASQNPQFILLSAASPSARVVRFAFTTSNFQSQCHSSTPENIFSNTSMHALDNSAWTFRPLYRILEPKNDLLISHQILQQQAMKQTRRLSTTERSNINSKESKEYFKSGTDRAPSLPTIPTPRGERWRDQPT